VPNSKRHFGSDNYAGICPEAWAALEAANEGHAAGYGDDLWTGQATKSISEVFETECDVFFVFNGTAANALSLASLCQSYHCILCHSTAHVECDECGAPEFFTNGARIVRLPGVNGKLTPEEIRRTAGLREDVHYPKARAVTLTQATEVGTVYAVDEVAAIGAVCEELGLRLHMDGARFANAVASLDVAPKELTWKAGVDVLSFGGTKNGIGLGEAVVFFNRDLAVEFDYRRKQAGQLASKMRFLSAPWIGLLGKGAWLRHARHANRMAEYVAESIRERTELKILYPREANMVFVDLPDATAERLWKKDWKFYEFPACGGHRLMCAWDTEKEDVESLMRDLREEGRR